MLFKTTADTVKYRKQTEMFNCSLDFYLQYISIRLTTGESLEINVSFNAARRSIVIEYWFDNDCRPTFRTQSEFSRNPLVLSSRAGIIQFDFSSVVFSFSVHSVISFRVEQLEKSSTIGNYGVLFVRGSEGAEEN